MLAFQCPNVQRDKLRFFSSGGLFDQNERRIGRLKEDKKEESLVSPSNAAAQQKGCNAHATLAPASRRIIQQTLFSEFNCFYLTSDPAIEFEV